MRNHKRYLAVIVCAVLAVSALVAAPRSQAVAAPVPSSTDAPALLHRPLFDVLVMNGMDAPVPTMLTNTDPITVRDAAMAARMPFTRWAILDLEERDYLSVPVVTVPKGQVLHLVYVNVDACDDPEFEMTANLTDWPEGYTADPNNPPDDHVIPKVKLLLTTQGVFRGYRHYGSSQMVSADIQGGHALWAELYRTASRGHGEARVWVNGYFMPAPTAAGTPGW